MQKLLVKNFGPIKSGYTDSNDGFFDISKLSIFVGDQGTGKSSIAKIISLFSWIEKQSKAKNSDPVNLLKTNSLSHYLNFHRIDSFLSHDTKIQYFTDSISICYENGKFDIENLSDNYIRPKVLYIPAERSFCTAISNPNKVVGMPSNVLDFLSDYYDSVKAQNGERLQLPLNGYEFRFSDNENTAYISDKNNGYEIKIEAASSGIQSLAPMYVTIHHYLTQLSLSINNRKNELNLSQLQQLKELEQSISISKKEILNQQKKIINSRLICIIEEPEQSLFPTSQYEMIMKILKGFSNNSENSLVITTHSPYILETINNSIYADSISSSGKNVDSIIPNEFQISYNNVKAYKIEDGEIHSIMDDEIKQINPSAIDKCSKKITDIYTKLSDIDFGE